MSSQKGGKQQSSSDKMWTETTINLATGKKTTKKVNIKTMGGDGIPEGRGFMDDHPMGEEERKAVERLFHEAQVRAENRKKGIKMKKKIKPKSKSKSELKALWKSYTKARKERSNQMKHKKTAPPKKWLKKDTTEKKKD